MKDQFTELELTALRKQFDNDESWSDMWEIYKQIVLLTHNAEEWASKSDKGQYRDATIFMRKVCDILNISGNYEC